MGRWRLPQEERQKDEGDPEKRVSPAFWSPTPSSRCGNCATRFCGLDHGKQIAFTDEVELYCNAYEEFLANRKLPKSRADVEKMSQALLARQAAEREKAQRTQAQKLEAELEKGGSEAALRRRRISCASTAPKTCSRRSGPDPKI